MDISDRPPSPLSYIFLKNHDHRQPGRVDTTDGNGAGLPELIEEHGLSKVLSSLAEYCFVNGEQRTGEALLAESIRLGNKEWRRSPLS